MEVNQVLQSKLIGYIEDAYAMENQIAEVLQRQIDVSASAPEIQHKLVQHLAETEVQRKRMEQRLEFYGKSPSTLKSVVSNFMGNMVGVTGAMRGDMLARNVRDDYVTEHLEIAAYTMLIATARLCNDVETIRVAQMSLNEEIAMAEWLFQRLPEACYMTYEMEGIEIPAQMMKQAHEGHDLRVTFEPLKDVQDARASKKIQ